MIEMKSSAVGMTNKNGQPFAVKIYKFTDRSNYSAEIRSNGNLLFTLHTTTTTFEEALDEVQKYIDTM